MQSQLLLSNNMHLQIPLKFTIASLCNLNFYLAVICISKYCSLGIKASLPFLQQIPPRCNFHDTLVQPCRDFPVRPDVSSTDVRTLTGATSAIPCPSWRILLAHTLGHLNNRVCKNKQTHNNVIDYGPSEQTLN